MVILYILFSLILIGCEMAEVTSPESNEEKTIQPSYQLVNCKLQVVDFINEEFNGFQIIFDNTSGKYQSLDFTLMCGTIRNYETWHYIDVGRQKETVYGSYVCKNTEDICIILPAILDCPTRTVCFSQYN